MPYRPPYKSDTYYRVVLGTGRFHGWRCIFAGDGTLQFQHENGETRSFHAQGMGWLSKAWSDFVTTALQGDTTP